MFGISAENIVEHSEGPDTPLDDDADVDAVINFNQTDPLLISDGVDRITVVRVDDDRFLVDYWGYRTGYLRVTREGVGELGESLLTAREPVPDWLLRTDGETDDLPEWIPDEYSGEPTIPCQRCDSPTAASNILTPQRLDGGTTDRFCIRCWEDVRDQWPLESGDDDPALEQAISLRNEAQSDAATADTDEIRDVLEADDPDARRHALSALQHVSDEDPDAALDALPQLASQIESEHQEIRALAVACLSTLADEFPRRVTPVADDVVDVLDLDAPDVVLTNAISFVAAVAAVEPRAVLDAVPKLAALLEQDPGRERDAVVAIQRIAKAQPASVLPVVPELLSHVEDDESNFRVTTLGALGYISKDYPNVAESAIPTLVELLDADADRLRANAAGLLAELADEYPADVRTAVPRAIELLEDEDEKARYNATSILARVAKADPDAVEPATDSLVDVLSDDFDYTRFNACWALGYLEAQEAREALEAAERTDPHEEVRQAAGWALQQLD